MAFQCLLANAKKAHFALKRFIMQNYKNLNAAINDYRERGYDLSFDLRSDGLGCQRLRAIMEPHEFEIEGALAFPDENAYLYPVNTMYNAKGLLQIEKPIQSAELEPEMREKFAGALA